jgi:hypothetical protein
MRIRRMGEPMHPKIFSDHAELHDYAKRHGPDYVWEGTAAFERQRSALSLWEFQVVSVHTRKGTRKALLFSKAISKTQRRTGPWHQARRAARLHGIGKDTG